MEKPRVYEYKKYFNLISKKLFSNKIFKLIEYKYSYILAFQFQKNDTVTIKCDGLLAVFQNRRDTCEFYTHTNYN